MKTAGIIIISIGLLITVVTGFNYITKEKVVDIGKLEITRDRTDYMSWSPIIGLAVLAIGAGIFLYAQKNK
jgi:hypothetical protein